MSTFLQLLRAFFKPRSLAMVDCFSCFSCFKFLPPKVAEKPPKVVPQKLPLPLRLSTIPFWAMKTGSFHYDSIHNLNGQIEPWDCQLGAKVWSLRNVGFAWLKLNQTDEMPRLELRISATDDGYVTEDGLNAM